MKIATCNFIKRIIALSAMYILFWEIYAVVRYQEVLFFSRFIRGGQYAFSEYAVLAMAVFVAYGILAWKFDKHVYGMLKSSGEDFKIIWHNIVKPLEDVKYTAVLILLFLSIFGYEIFNYTLSLDEEVHMAGFRENISWCREGRFSIAILKDFLMEFGMYQPCLSNLLGAVFLLLTSLCIFSLISDKLSHARPNKYLSIVFLAGFLSFPTVISLSQSYSTYCVEISLGMFFTALAVVYLDRYFVTGHKRNIAINIILLVFSLGIYQAMAEMYIALVIIYFLVLVLNETEITNKKARICLRLMLLSVACFVTALIIFFLIYKFATTLHFAEGSIEYINGFSDWDLEYGVIASLTRSIRQLMITLEQTQIPGIKYFSYYMILGMVLTGFCLLAYPNLKGALCGGLTFLATVSGYFMWISLAALSLPFRAWLASPVICGFLYFMTAYIVQMRFHKRYYLLCQIAIAIVLFHQIQTINELFYNDHVRMEKDVTFARELYHDICYETGTPNAETPILFIGTVDLGDDDAIIKLPYTEKYWGGNTLGYSIWRRAQEPQRMKGLYECLGYTLNIDKCTNQDMIAFAQSEMTVYPQKGSIVSKGGVVYVRLQ